MQTATMQAAEGADAANEGVHSSSWRGVRPSLTMCAVPGAAMQAAEGADAANEGMFAVHHVALA